MTGKLSFLIIICLIWSLFLFEGAKSVNAGEKIPIGAQIVLYKAQQLAGQKKIDQAIEILKKYNAKERLKKRAKTDSRNYGHFLVDFNLGNFYFLNNAIDKAAVSYQAVVKKNPDFSPAWINLARCNYELARFLKAGECFAMGYKTGYASLNEKKPELLYYSAISFMTGNDYQKALNIFKELLASDPKPFKLIWQEALVQVYLALKKPYKALPHIINLAEKTTGSKQLNWQEILLQQYLELGMQKKALEYLTDLTRKDPLQQKWWKGLVHLHLAQNHQKKALVALTVYEYIKPLSRDEQKLKADLSLMLGIPKQAAICYENILADGLEPAIIKRIAQSLQSLQNYSKALQWIEKGLEKFKGQELLMQKGNLLYEMEKYESAMAAYQETAEFDKTKAGQAWLMMGYAAWNMNDLISAKKALTRAAKYKNPGRAAKRALKQLKKMDN